MPGNAKVMLLALCSGSKLDTFFLIRYLLRREDEGRKSHFPPQGSFTIIIYRCITKLFTFQKTFR